MLNGQCGDVGVGDQIAAYASLIYEVFENLKVQWPRMQWTDGWFGKPSSDG